MVASPFYQSAQMHPRRKSYNSLDELYNERDAISWYWRLAALAASWMILAGYLIFPSTFDSDPDLRFGRTSLAVIIAILLTCGYSLTALLSLLVPSWLFQSESIFYPAICSSALGLLAALYAFASSPRYNFNAAAGVLVALTSSSTAIYAILLLWVQRKISRVRRTPTPVYQAAPVETPMLRGARESATSTTALWQGPSFYQNWLQNMHPSAVRNPSINTQASLQSLQDRSPSPPYHQQIYYDPTNTTTTSTGTYNAVPTTSVPPSPFHPHNLTEDDLVNQQMARLLLHTNDAHANDSQQSTFRIDWRTDDDEDADPAQRGIQMRTRTGSGSRLIPPNRLAASATAQGLRNASSSKSMREDVRAPTVELPPSRAARLSPFRGGDSARAGDVQRGREDQRNAGGSEAQRAKSREERRREIELGNVASKTVVWPEGRATAKKR